MAVHTSAPSASGPEHQLAMSASNQTANETGPRYVRGWQRNINRNHAFEKEPYGCGCGCGCNK